MKSTVAPYETSVKCLRIVCTNGTEIRIARYPFDLTMSNTHVYKSNTGYDISSTISETSFAALSVDLEGIIDAAGITREQIAAGVLDGAECFLFATSFLAPIEDYEPLAKSILGKTTLDDDVFRIEEMGLADLLSQTVGWSHTAQCQNEFGGQEYGGCHVNLAAITVTGAVTSVASGLVFSDSSRAEAADHFGWGTVEFTSGPNAGLKPIRVRDFSSGQFTLYEPPYHALTNGVTYSATPGCRKRLVDCQRHNNVPRFGGDLYVPLGSTVKAIGGAA